MSDNTKNEPVEVPINGILDLHHFSPRDLKYLIPDYIMECRKRNITELRLIHGKGTGSLRRSVHSLLEKSPYVASFKLAGHEAGGWGATVVWLVDEEHG